MYYNRYPRYYDHDYYYYDRYRDHYYDRYSDYYYDSQYSIIDQDIINYGYMYDVNQIAYQYQYMNGYRTRY